MSRTDTRRHRRGRTDDTKPSADQGEPTVTPQPVALESRETEGFLLHRLHTANSDAEKAQQQVQAAAAEAHRQDQIATQIDSNMKEIANQLRQLQADKEAATRRAEEARNASAAFTAQREEYNKQAADALRLCEAAGIQLQPNGTDPAGPARIDVAHDDPLTGPMPVDPTADDPRMNGPMSRFNEAHDEEQQGTQAGAA